MGKVIELNENNYAKFMKFFSSVDYERRVSIGCDYYYLIDSEDADRDFEVGQDYILGSESGIDWLESQV